MSENFESIEAPEITDEAINDFLDQDGEAPSYHPILQVWAELLSNAHGELNAKVTPQWANRITSSYREVNFRDMPAFREATFGKLVRFHEILTEEIGKLDHPFESITTPEEDVEFYGVHYKNVLRDWQVELMGWELDWECESETAAVELAAVSEVHKMMFGPTGITQFLDNIKLEITEADQAETVAALEALKEGR